jgi:hypothetical protein
MLDIAWKRTAEVGSAKIHEGACFFYFEVLFIFFIYSLINLMSFFKDSLDQ